MPQFQIEAIGEYQYFLYLNPMMGNMEDRTEFGPFPTMEAAKQFYDAEVVAFYQDEGPNQFDYGGDKPTKMYTKGFRKGGPLEWMNRVESSVSRPGEEIDWTNPEGFSGRDGHGIILALVGVTKAVKKYQIS